MSPCSRTGGAANLALLRSMLTSDAYEPDHLPTVLDGLAYTINRDEEFSMLTTELERTG